MKKSAVAFSTIIGICCLFIGNDVNGESVLFWMPFVFKSATLNYMPLAEELANRGHEVTVVTSYVKKGDAAAPHPNLKQIHTGNRVQEIADDISNDLFSGKGSDFSNFIPTVCGTVNASMALPEVKEILNSKAKSFDMVIVYVDFTCCEVGYYLAEHFNTPLVLFSTFQTSWSYVNWAMGQTHNPAYQAMDLLDLKVKGKDMNFWQRYMNTAVNVLVQLNRQYQLIPMMEDMLDKHFPDVTSRTPLLELERNASLAFSFGHPLLRDGWRPTSPNFIQLGMMNCVPAQKFAKNDNVGQFLESANNTGVIYFSFGSLIQGSKMPEGLRKNLVNVFAKLKPMKVLWKWETEQMPDKPDNVMLSKWLPQQDVLGHSNVKLFLSHGGQSSFQESLCHKKPMVVMSFFGDQLANGAETEILGIGKHLTYKDFSEDRLLNDINEVLSNKDFQTRVTEVGTVLLDQIDKPLDRAVWWIEHVLRQPNLYAGISPVHKLTWYQYFLLDVISFTILILIVIAIILHYICMWTCCRKSGKKSSNKKAKKH